MVLTRLVLAALVLSGCGKSLFDNGPGGDDTPGGDGGVDSNIDAPPVQTTCEAPCLGDAAGEFDGSAGGSTGRWRYLDDTRDRQWTAMTGTMVKTGAMSNQITKCDASNTGACAALPGALLFTSTGATSPADPAIELTLPEAKVVQLSLRVRVPAGGREQVVRLYRSSREDALVTASAMPDTTLEQAIVIDALPGERILFAMAPLAAGTPDVAVHLFASDTQMVFPQSCQMAVRFEPADVMQTTKIRNACSTNNLLTAMNDDVPASNPDEEIAPVLVAGPFAEQGMAGDFILGRYYDSSVISDHSGDFTWQFWFKFDDFTLGGVAYMISDIDVTNGPAGGGFTVDVFQGTEVKLESFAVVDGTNPDYVGETTAYLDNDWHFIRLIQRGDNVSVCVDGERKFGYTMLAGTGTSAKTVRLGRNQFNPQQGLLDGQLDDVRVFKGALPCE